MRDGTPFMPTGDKSQSTAENGAAKGEERRDICCFNFEIQTSMKFSNIGAKCSKEMVAFQFQMEGCAIPESEHRKKLDEKIKKTRQGACPCPVFELQIALAN
jgi:hypothetical protein